MQEQVNVIFVDKQSQKSHKTPQHSTPIKNVSILQLPFQRSHEIVIIEVTKKTVLIFSSFQILASPAASLSPVKHEISTNYLTSQTWDSPSILRAGSALHMSSTQSGAPTPQKNASDSFVENNSVKNHDIYHSLTQNNTTETETSSEKYKNYFDHATSASGKGDTHNLAKENIRRSGTHENSDHNEEEVSISH